MTEAPLIGHIGEQPMQSVAVGVWAAYALKSMEALSQRIVLRTHLSGLAQDEIKAYIKHQLDAAGYAGDLFSDDVVHEIFQQARGLPRLINTLCYQCLFEIYLQNKNFVDMPTLEKVLCDLDSL